MKRSLQAERTTFSKKAIYLGIFPAVFFYLTINFGPSLATFVLSFTNITGTPGLPWEFIGLRNYREFFIEQNTRDTILVFRNTVIFSLAVTLIQNAVALPIAVTLNNKGLVGRNVYRAIIFLPVVLGVFVTAYTWRLMFNPLDGPIANFISIFGWQSNFFNDPRIALWLVIFCQIWMAMGYSMVINLAGLQAIPNELYEAGLIDGTSGTQAFRYITMPMLWPTVSVNILLAIIGSLQSFQIILFTTGAGNFHTRTLVMHVYANAFNLGGGMGSGSMRQGYAAAVAMILFLFILTVTIISQRFISRKGMDS